MGLADKILFLRKRLGLSQEELAEQLDVSRQSVSKWESDASVPDISKVIALAEFFSVSIDYLLKDEIDLLDINDDSAAQNEKAELKKLNNNRIKRLILEMYWSIIALIYFSLSFITFEWGKTWVVWAIAPFLLHLLEIVFNLEDKVEGLEEESRMQKVVTNINDNFIQRIYKKPGLLKLYWPVIGLVYLIFSILTGDFGTLWVIWIVAPLVYIILKVLLYIREEESVTY